MKTLMRRTFAGALIVAAAWALASAQAARFQYHGILSRVITPNGDGRNDVAILCFDNFSDAGVDGVVYTPLGSEVGRMTRQDPALAGCPGGNKPQSLTWDGRSQGAPAPSGLYVYKIRTELRLFTGMLLVVR